MCHLKTMRPGTGGKGGGGEQRSTCDNYTATALKKVLRPLIFYFLGRSTECMRSVVKRDGGHTKEFLEQNNPEITVYYPLVVCCVSPGVSTL